MNKYLHYNNGETKVNLNISANNNSEKIIKKKNTATSGKLIIAVRASYVCVYRKFAAEYQGGLRPSVFSCLWQGRNCDYWATMVKQK
jgi:hypothetical protein